jgi:hypothetical protein
MSFAVVPLLRGGDEDDNDDTVRGWDRADDNVLLAANEEMLLPSLPCVVFEWGTFVGASVGAAFLR